MEKDSLTILQNQLFQKLERLFHQACKSYHLLEDGDHILVGLSGGKDSLALVELLGRQAQIWVPRIQVTAVHVRVRERKYISDTHYLEQFCAQWKVPLLIRDTEIGGEEKKDPCFLCSWYRRKALLDTAQELGCNKIALGHHRDDILETLLMNLIYQGQFSSIPPRLALDKMPLQMIRPLCMIDEKDLAHYADLCHYEKQTTLCEFEKASSRTTAKQILSQWEQLNPHVRESLWGAMSNIKTNYIP